MEKIELLATYLEIDVEDISVSGHDENTFEVGRAEYMVLTDEEADEKVAEHIKETLWAFNAYFLANYTDLPEEVFTALQDRCEGANETFFKLIKRADGGFEGFVEDAVRADGRGHFLSGYDGEENEIYDDEECEYFYIYRTN